MDYRETKPFSAEFALEAGARLRGARFLVSAAEFASCPPDRGAEIAFAGRSNAGKSSAINALCDNRSLCRVAKAPGRTRLINFFTLDQGAELRLVDLPGYGYARVTAAQKRVWATTLETYFQRRLALCGLVLIVDIRRGLLDGDKILLDWARSANRHCLVLFNKSDKLSRQAAQKTLRAHAGCAPPPGEEQLFSALNKQGVERAQQWIFDRLLANAG